MKDLLEISCGLDVHKEKIVACIREAEKLFCHKRQSLHKKYALRNCLGDCRETEYLSAWYWRIKQKKGSKKAIVALARKLLVIIHTMLKQGTLFDESCFEARRKNCEQKQLSRYIQA